ncbi:unnamed protein product [Sphenostylis stenocarpa]|uniref:AAA+ ATPase domain-containing protein n=1 Tax=Sphenostylis stenocarpa TaxID=92480 RepID=A0AA86T224_9FABA|nr:unnamed protein product [Sphenostylis stenocarpa]
MGRRIGGGRSLQQTLRRRIEACKTIYPTAEKIAHHLRLTYSDYRRTKHQTLVRFVQEALHSTTKLNHTPTPNRTHDDDGESQSTSRKRRKKIDEGGERLQTMEALLHVGGRVQIPSSSSSVLESDDEETLSMSEDAIYGDKVEPGFDLMKTMLRMSYTPKKVLGEEKNVELEVGNSSKGTAASAPVNEETGNSSKVTFVNEERNSVLNDEVKRNDGPRFKDLGGMKEVLKKLRRMILPLFLPHTLLQVKVMNGGILLHGPSGCGKTTLANAIANVTGLPFYQISATEVVSGVSGASEEYIRELFVKAQRTAPSIIFIDEIDVISSKRDNLQSGMERRIVSQLMTCMDQLNNPADSENSHGYVLVIGATNRLDAVDPNLRRPGRFKDEIMITNPDESARKEILSLLTSHIRFDGSFDIQKIARVTSGFVGADLRALVEGAYILAIERNFDEKISELSQNLNEDAEYGWRTEDWSAEGVDIVIKMSDFEETIKMMQPSLKRKGFSTLPDVKWEDVGGFELLRKEFELYITRRIKYPESYETLGVAIETGFLLYGPPGCGKTLIAKAVANEAGASFIYIKGAELLNKYVGESELAVRSLFDRARTCAPCIIFFDEFDALATKRGTEGSWVTERLLNQLLLELDGAEQRRGVFVIGATNRPDVIDHAVLRPGRFGKLVYVPLPSPDQRVLILKAIARKMNIDASVDLSAIARSEACENMSGADLAALMNEASIAALEDTTQDEFNKIIKSKHFEIALSKVSRSVSDKQKQYYEQLSENLKACAKMR